MLTKAFFIAMLGKSFYRAQNNVIPPSLSEPLVAKVAPNHYAILTSCRPIHVPLSRLSSSSLDLPV